MSRPATVYKTLTGNRLAETAKAVLFQVKFVSGHPVEKVVSEWFPLSQISKLYKDPTQPDCDWIMVPEWILGQKDKIKWSEDSAEEFGDGPPEEPEPEVQDTYEKFDVDGLNLQDTDVPF